ncbi:MAG: HAD family hydrolase [Rhodospirillaceae bacterium]
MFDCDGVLVDSEPIAARVLRRYLEDLRFPVVVAEDEHERFLGYKLEAMQAELEAEADAALPHDFVAELRRRDAIAFADELTAIDGVADAVRALAHPYCVASSGPQAKIRNSLRLTGMLALFEPHLFSAQDPGVARGKPAPDLFLHAAERMGRAPADGVVVEDSVAGVRAGVAAGMRVLGFTGGGHCGPGHGERLRDAGAGRVFDRMRDLPALLAAL